MGCKGSKSTAVEKTTTERPDVYITTDEAVAYLVQELGVSEEKAREVVDKCNKDGDGKISNNELSKFVEEVKKIKGQFNEKFAEYDKDNTGFVSKEEAETVIKQELPNFPENRVKGFVENFAGDDGKISRDEFVLFYGGLKSRRNKLEQLFTGLDEDDNGEVSADAVEKCMIEEGGMTDRQAATLIKDSDYNKDGKINKKEFSSAWSQLMGDK